MSAILLTETNYNSSLAPILGIFYFFTFVLKVFISHCKQRDWLPLPMNTPFLAVQVDFVEKGPVRFPLLRLYSMAPNPNAIDATRVSIHQERDGRRFVLLPISFVSSLEREREREREREKSLLVGVSFSLIVYSLSLSAVFVLGDLSFSRPSADLYPAASISFRFDGSNVIVFNARRLWTDPTVQTTTPSISRVDDPTGNERREREGERWDLQTTAAVRSRRESDGSVYVFPRHRKLPRCWPTKFGHPIPHCPTSSTRTMAL